jgi:GNAT superfamily N-acetyltransferase
MTGHSIRPVRAGDARHLASLIRATELFPAEMLPDMLAPYLAAAGEGAEGQGEFWLTDATGMHGVAYAAPERLTDGTWNLLLIAVHPARQGSGLGPALLRAAEAGAALRGGRLMIVETSGLPGFARPRAFYSREGYAAEARIRGFYAEGDDKIVFTRPLPRTAEGRDIRGT